jgi:iron complex transport system ATP-binding protein
MSLQVKNATFAYDKSRNIFEGLTFSVKPYEVLCILGANGIGKTTLLKSLSGVLKLKSGDIYIDDQNTRTMDRAQIARTLGYLPQEHSTVFPYTVLQIVLMGRAPYLSLFSSPSKGDVEIAEMMLDRIGISHLKDKPYNEISGGQKQLVLFARILTQGPKVLLLDEPTSHLDFKNQILALEMIKKLAKEGLAVVMTSHFPNNAFLYSNRVAIMKGGRFLAVGNTDEVMTEENLSHAYDMDVEVLSVKTRSNESLKFCISKSEVADEKVISLEEIKPKRKRKNA